MMSVRWTNYIVAILAGAVVSIVAAPGVAQFPTRPIRIIVPYTPGGTGELMARLVADRMTATMTHTTIIEHRPGAGTTLGAAIVARAPADGYTIFMNASSFLINAQLMSNLPYDPQTDFEPVTYAASNPHVLVVSPTLGVRTMKEFLALVKGGDLSYASFGIGSSNHLAFEVLKNTYGFKMIHVPYKGTQQAMTDVMGGNVQAMLADLPASMPLIKAGKLVALGVASERRAAAFPELPTIEEVGGKAFASGSWFGFLVRSGTPREIRNLLNQVINNALSNPEVKHRLGELGMETHGTTSDDFASFMKLTSVQFADAIKISGAKIE